MFFYREGLLAPRPTPKLEDHPSSVVRDCLFNLFAATLLIGGRSSIRNLRTRHAVVTGTHYYTWIVFYSINIIYKCDGELDTPCLELCLITGLLLQCQYVMRKVYTESGLEQYRISLHSLFFVAAKLKAKCYTATMFCIVKKYGCSKCLLFWGDVAFYHS